MNKGVNICMISYYLPPDLSGAAKQAWNLAKILSKKGFNVILIGRQKRGHSTTERIDGVTIIRLSGKLLSSSWLKKNIFTLKLIIWLLQNYKKFDVLHYHGIFPFIYPIILIGIFLGKGNLVKMSLLGVDDPLSISLKPFWGNIKLGILSKVNYAISISPALSSACLKTPLQNKLLEIPNGVDVLLYSPSPYKISLRKSLGFDNQNIVIYVGGITRRKGVDTLIRAWRQVVNKHPESVLLLVGSNNKNRMFIEYSKEINQLINILKLGDTVRFLGQVDDVVRLFQVGDIFVLPSRGEGLPNSLLEAMSCGLPCVASLLPGITDFIIDNNRDGLLIKDYMSFSDFAGSISWLINNENKRKWMGEMARKKIINKFSLYDIADKYAEVYRAFAPRILPRTNNLPK